ncbi:hypothetical protein [Rhizobium johnstonii]|uniref:hypothetical protein n=1 Tax=Rhizobium johnstonii TaxID=3019933 RepID=UPI002DDD7A7A|nr:hypothetical protein U8P72_11890 [Rhizobium johnstonii]
MVLIGWRASTDTFEPNLRRNPQVGRMRVQVERPYARKNASRRRGVIIDKELRGTTGAALH